MNEPAGLAVTAGCAVALALFGAFLLVVWFL